MNFGYTGQAWLPSLGLWYYKARMYEPELGRFLQPDPIGYDDSPNLYAYVLNDPINLIDPLGLAKQDIIVIGIKPKDMKPGLGFGGRVSGGLGGVFGPGERSDAQPDAPDIIVICDAVCRARSKRRTAQARAISTVAVGLDRLANLIGPGEQKLPGETFEQCLQRIAGPEVAGLIAGTSGVLAGAALLGYPRGTPGGGGTSLISAAARGSFGRETRMGTRRFGTTSVGGAVGRGLSAFSVLGGAALAGHSGGRIAGAIQVCR